MMIEMEKGKSKKFEKYTKELDVIRINTKYFITAMFPAEAMSLYLKPVYVLVRTFDGKVIISDVDLNVVKEFAWLVHIKHEDVSII